MDSYFFSARDIGFDVENGPEGRFVGRDLREGGMETAFRLFAP
jgi:hypothetical protein